LIKPLCDNISKPPVWRRGMRVILNRQTEVSLFGIAWTLQYILAWPDQLNDNQGQIRKVVRISGLALKQKIVECLGIGLRGKVSPRAAAS